MTIQEIIQQPEGRRLEFKASLPASAELTKSIVAFANDAGVELFLGIQDNPRKIVGINEEQLIALEEKVSSIIHDHCTPVILPEIMFHNIEGKYIIRIQIYKGSQPPYHLKSKGNVALQAQQAYQFILRHISQGTTDYQGVYRNDRWEYPIVAIREVIRNAVIHRDYALAGKDIKIAIFDDKLEITSPGKLMPSVDYSLMDSGQSDIRNKILAPVFKKLGIIEQWGNGLRLIADELKKYPEILLSWREPGIAFRVTFTNTNFQKQHELQQELQQESKQESVYSKVLKLLNDKTLSTRDISGHLGQKSISGHLKRILSRLIKDGLVEWTEPDAVKSSKQ